MSVEANYQNDNELSREWKTLLGNIGSPRPVDVPPSAPPPVDCVLGYLLSLCPAAPAAAPILHTAPGGVPSRAPRKGRKKGHRSNLDNMGNSPMPPEYFLKPGQKWTESEEYDRAHEAAKAKAEAEAIRTRTALIEKHPIEKRAVIIDFLKAVDTRRDQSQTAARHKAGRAALREKSNGDVRHEVLTGIQRAVDEGNLTQSHMRSITACGRRPIPCKDEESESIAIHAYPVNSDGKISYTHSIVGVQHCGSPLRCPECSAKISYVRREQVQKAVQVMAGEENCSSYMLTLTAPHTYNTDIVNFVQRMNEATKLFGKSATWKKFATAVNYQGQITANELTVDSPWSEYKTGPHFHKHKVLFILAVLDDECLSICRDALAHSWTECCEKVGLVPIEKLTVHREHGLHFEPARSLDSTLEYLLKEVSFEISPPPLSKSGRREGDRISQWQLMRLAMSTHPELLADLDQVMLALAGVRALHWSSGLKKRCGIKSITDQDIAAAPATEETEIQIEAAENAKIVRGEEGIEIIQIQHYEWSKICAYGARRLLVKSLDLLANGQIADEQTARDVIKKICHGINPVTGEILRLIKSRYYTWLEYRGATSITLAVAA